MARAMESSGIPRQEIVERERPLKTATASSDERPRNRAACSRQRMPFAAFVLLMG